MKVDLVKKYKACDTCHKKVGPANNGAIECEHCKSVTKEKFCDKGAYAKIVFFTEKKQKLNLTMFNEELKVAVPDALKKTEDDIKDALVRTGDMSITKSSNDIVTSITLE